MGFMITFSACSQKEKENKKEVNKPIINSEGNIKKLNTEKENSSNLQTKQTKQENNQSKINHMKTSQATVGNNSALVKEYKYAVLKTNFGNIKVEFYGGKAPITVGNFLKLAKDGFYDKTKFHRVIKGFMIQGGDPNSKDNDWSNDGIGGPGYEFKDELTGQETYPQGTLAMANSGPNTNGSQFFIVTANPKAPLPPLYTVFGKVVQGMETALKIENVKVNENDHPLEDVIVKTIEPLVN